MRRAHYIWIALSVMMLAAISAHAGDTLGVVAVESPTLGHALTPFLASSGDALFMSWLEKTANGHTLKLARWDGAAFGAPHTIRESDSFFANWADFASVLPFGEGRLAAHWLEKAAAGTYEYDVWVAISEDAGASWGKPERPHRDGTLSEHGFVSMVPQVEGGFAAAWLDGRQFKKGASDNEMTLRFARYTGDGFADEVLLDGRVCECCQTGMATTDNGLFVAYRDRSDAEIRDISFVREVDGVWTEPATLHEDGWEIPGCPVNGPQVASMGNRLAVAWFTGSLDDARVQLRSSDDGGESFGAPIRVDDGNPVGRVDVEWLGADAAVTWVERLEGRNGDVRLKRVSADGVVSAPLVIAKTGSGRASGFPRIAPFGGELFAAWTESYDRKGPSEVHVARITAEPVLIDEPAFSFEAKGVDGTMYRLSELSGSVVLVNFWGIWCKSCREEIPRLVELDRKWRKSGLVVLGADYGDEPSALPAFIDELDMSYPVLLDDGLADDYEVLVYPTSVVIDRRGRVRHRVEGYTAESFRTLTKVVERLLAES